MDDLNVAKVKEWAIELGKKFNTLSQPLTFQTPFPSKIAFNFSQSSEKTLE
jgi:hypothetical protein